MLLYMDAVTFYTARAFYINGGPLDCSDDGSKAPQVDYVYTHLPLLSLSLSLWRLACVCNSRHVSLSL